MANGKGIADTLIYTHNARNALAEQYTLYISCLILPGGRTDVIGSFLADFEKQSSRGCWESPVRSMSLAPERPISALARQSRCGRLCSQRPEQQEARHCGRLGVSGRGERTARCELLRTLLPTALRCHARFFLLLFLVVYPHSRLTTTRPSSSPSPLAP